MADVTPLTKHPAKFSDPIVDLLHMLVYRELTTWGEPVSVFDPFAGVGRVHRLATRDDIRTHGMEIEPEWAACHSQTVCGDSLAYMATTATRYRVIATSPCYGNRYADHHEAQDGSTRRSYRHDLGRMPTEGSNATFAWGPKYWAFMVRAYWYMHRVLVPGGVLLLNVSDFVSRKVQVPAVAWHDGACWGAGFTRKEKALLVETQRMRFGENGEARAPHEVILVHRKAG